MENTYTDLDEIVVDDSVLLADRLVRSLHRNDDGHLASNQQSHESSVELRHNVAVLYIYTTCEDGHMLHEHYIYSSEPLSYKAWRDAVFEEIDQLNEERDESFIGVHAWATAFIKITPMRTGDLFIKVDEMGATGVRLAFNSSKNKRTACEE